MADFYRVHNERISRAMDGFAKKKGEFFCIAMLEVVEPPVQQGPLFAAVLLKKTTPVRFVRTDADGSCRPAFEADVAAVQDWQDRHVATPEEAFRMPDPFAARFGPPVEDMPS